MCDATKQVVFYAGSTCRDHTRTLQTFFSPYRGASKRNESENGSDERRGSQQHMVHLLLSFRTTKIKTSNNKTRNFMSLFSSSLSPSPSWSFFYHSSDLCVSARLPLYHSQTQQFVRCFVALCCVWLFFSSGETENIRKDVLEEGEHDTNFVILNATVALYQGRVEIDDTWRLFYLTKIGSSTST